MSGPDVLYCTAGQELHDPVMRHYTKPLSVTLIWILLASSIASATELNIIYGSDREKINYTLDSFFDSSVFVSSNAVKIYVSEKANYTINKILIFICKNKLPDECIISQRPLEYGKSVSAEIQLSDVQKAGEGRILVFANILDSSWVAKSFLIKGSSASPEEIQGLDISAKFNIDEVKSTIQNYGMVPLNLIDAVSGFNNLKSVKATHAAGNNLNFSSQMQSIDSNAAGYQFAFSNNSGPITFFNLGETCGNAKCEKGSGETYNSCWLDCLCPAGQAATVKGCKATEGISIVIDSISPEKLRCAVQNSTCASSYLLAKLHIENAPTNFTIESPVFSFENKSYTDILCSPVDLNVRGIVTGETRANNQTKYSCSIQLPEIRNIQYSEDIETVENRSLLITFPMSIQTQNGTKIIPVSGKASLQLNIFNAEQKLRHLDELGEDLEKQKHKANIVQHRAKNIELTTAGIAATLLAICASTTLPSLGATYDTCIKGALFTKISLIVAAANEGIKAAVAKYYDIKVTNAARRLRGELNYAQRGQEESKKEALVSLVWASGNESGSYVDSVCGNEKVDIKFSFEPFQCKELLIGFNGDFWPFCNCASQHWIDEGFNPLGGTCVCANTSAYYWKPLIKYPTGDVSYRVYNSTGIHTLTSTYASSLFAPHQGIKDIGLTIVCDSSIYGSVRTDSPFLKYKEVCSK